MNTEVCFPRGGTEKLSKRTVFNEDGEIIPTSKSSNNKANSKLKPNFAGKVSKAKSFTKTATPGSKKVKGKTKKVKAVAEVIKKVYEEDSVAFVPERLSTKKVVKGTLLLAAIKEIRDYELRVNLPNNLIGSVSITNMSDGYTGLLKRFAQSADDQLQLEELHSLGELFNVGQIIPCICVDEANSSQLLQLSINPKHLHDNLQPQNLHKDLVIYGCVNGVEDHGYRIDIGVSNITAFMPKTGTDKGLYVGSMRRFCVTESDVMGLISGETRTVTVNLLTSTSRPEQARSKDITFNSLLPGMLVEAKVHARKTEGLVVQVAALKGYVHVTHLTQHVKDFVPDEMSKFRVLSVNTATKYIHLTALPSLLNSIDSCDTGPMNVPLGEPVNITLNKIVDKYVFLKSEDIAASYMGVSLLPEKIRTLSKIADTKLKCYWFGWDYLESRPVFSTSQPNVKKSVLPTMIPGDAINAKLVKIGADGAKVLLASGFHAFIQNIHLTEVPLKNPEKKLKVGQTLPCKVLSVNMDTKRVRLTAKPSLVNSDLEPLSDLPSAKVGSLVKGVIVKLTSGALVAFYNNVVGFVGAANLAKEPIEHPADVFYIGQSVTCRILSCDAAKDKLALSFILDGDSAPSVKRKLTDTSDEGVKRRKVIPQGPKLSIGEVVSDWSVVSTTANGYNVISGLGHRAVLPNSELSDMPGIAELNAASLTVGSVVKDLVCITDNLSNYIVSNKLMFKYYSAKDGLAKDWKTLKVGDKHPGSVLSLTEHGIFISFGNGIVGLCPERLLPQNSKKYLSPGRSLLCKIVSIDTVKERMIVAIKDAECPIPRPDADLPYRMLAQNLSDLSTYQKWVSTQAKEAATASKVSGYAVGDIVKGLIVEKEEDLIRLKLENGVTAEAFGDLTSGCAARVGETALAIVMHVDLMSSKLTVLVDKHYLTDRKSCKAQSISTKVKVQQQIKSEVIYTRPEYTLAMLKGHANGRIAFIPTLQHPNSEYSTTGMFYGQENKVVIKQCDEENHLIIAAFQTEKEKQQTKAEEIQNALNLPATGSVVDAVISGKQPLQLNLKFNGRAGIGRVFVNEIDDNPAHGISPLAGFKEGQSLQVKVIGASTICTNKKLRSIKHNGHQVVLNCSLRQCNTGNWKPSVEELTVGKSYNCFVTEHEFSKKEKRLQVLTSGGNVAFISWFDVNESAVESAAVIKEKYPVGGCLKTELKAFGRDGVAYMKIAPADASTSSNSTPTCTGMVVEYQPLSGLILNTHFSPKSRVPLSEMAEPGVDLDLGRFKEGLVVNCRYVKRLRHGGVLLTLREESGLLPLTKVKKGMVLAAVVSQILPVKVQVMAAGHVIEVDMTAQKLKNFARNYRNGSACWVKVRSVNDRSIKAVICDPSKDKVKATKVVPHTSTPDSSDQSQSQLPETSSKSTKSVHNATSPQQFKDEDVAEEVVDKDTGVHILFKPVSSTSERPTLDFGASIASLQRNATEPGVGDVDSKLMQLEKAGKKLKPYPEPTVDKARSVELATSQTLDRAGQPESEAELLSVLKSSPSNGSIWSKLIMVTSRHKGVEAGRARAEQALETVPYRLEKEKMLVWSSFLEVEMCYGTEDSLDHIKRRALQQMDELKVYQELVKLYSKLQKVEEAEQCYRTMLRKWADQPAVWSEYGRFLFANSKVESARSLLQRCLKTLATKFHIEVIMKFAQMELAGGNMERFTTLFENVMSNFPKRTDVWSVYIDQLIKSEHYEHARNILRRAVMQKWNSKKIQFFIGKFKDFETKYGTEESLAEATALLNTV